MSNIVNIADLYPATYEQVKTWIEMYSENSRLNTIVLDRDKAIEFINSIIDDEALSTQHNCNLVKSAKQIKAIAEILGDYYDEEEEIDPEDLRSSEIDRMLSKMENDGVDVNGVKVCVKPAIH